MNETGLNAIVEVCAALSDGDIDKSREIISTKYPHNKTLPKVERAKQIFNKVPRQKSMFTAESIKAKTNNDTQMRLAIFMRDGFIDRYFGDKLIFSGTLRIISLIMPDIFPYQSHGDTKLCHQSWWDLHTSISHITPTVIGGSDSTENLLCASNRHTFQIKSSTPEEVGWKVISAGNLEDWDGTLSWYYEICFKKS